MDEKTHILVMDDDPDICMMLKIMLEYKNFSVFTTDNEPEARKILHDNRISVLIMDMLLSGADGTEICKRLKEEDEYKEIPILMFSAHPHAQERCLAAGADGFLGKPFEMNDMLAKVNSLLSAAKA
jgi:DNA-binding response OmpR family regulator